VATEFGWKLRINKSFRPIDTHNPHRKPPPPPNKNLCAIEINVLIQVAKIWHFKFQAELFVFELSPLMSWQVVQMTLFWDLTSRNWLIGYRRSKTK
jgi:hypothetical protein